MPESDNTTPHKAVEYDQSVRKVIPFYETIQSEVVDLVRTIRPDVNCWLDTGCGTGFMVERALSYFPHACFILTDPSEAMLKQAAIRLKDQPESRIRFLPATPSQDLGIYLIDVHPQVITAVLSHHYLHPTERRQATEVCYRLLEPEGVFVTVENITPGTDKTISLGLNRWMRFQVEQGRPKSIVEEHSKRFNSEYFPISIDEHLNLLRETGFKCVSVFWLSQMQGGFYAIK